MDREMHQSKDESIESVQTYGYGVRSTIYKCPPLAEQIAGMYEYCEKHPELSFNHEYDFVYGVVATNKNQSRIPLLQCASMQQLVTAASPNSHIIVGNRVAFHKAKDIVATCKLLGEMNITLSVLGHDWLDTRYSPIDCGQVINDVLMFSHYQNLQPNWRDNNAPYGWRWELKKAGPQLLPSAIERTVGHKVEALFDRHKKMSSVYNYIANHQSEFKLYRKRRKISYQSLAVLWVAHCLDYPKITPLELYNTGVVRALLTTQLCKNITKEDVIRRFYHTDATNGGYSFTPESELKPAKHQIDELEEARRDGNPYAFE